METAKQLKYLFRAEFDDCKEIRQTLDDKSVLDPENRSQFYDVLEYQKQHRLLSFTLEDESHIYKVDLQDGHFEIDGTPFKMHEKQFAVYELIFYRNHTHTFLQTVGAGEPTTEETSHKVVYRIGWKAKEDQKEQRVLQVE